MPGPVPKRQSQLRRQNRVEIDSCVAEGAVRGPEREALFGLGSRFYESLRRSAQAKWFQPSDWAAAELTAAAIDEWVAKPTVGRLAEIRSLMASLLVTEADRRRMRVEVSESDPVEEDVPDIDAYRRRSASAS